MSELPICPFCKNTGVHLCPDIAEPILVRCSHKKCPITEMQDRLSASANAPDYCEHRFECRDCGRRYDDIPKVPSSATTEESQLQPMHPDMKRALCNAIDKLKAMPNDEFDAAMAAYAPTDVIQCPLCCSSTDDHDPGCPNIVPTISIATNIDNDAEKIALRKERDVYKTALEKIINAETWADQDEIASQALAQYKGSRK